MDTRKIALACFIGGMVGVAVALIAVPELWWLGMLAGFVAGYFVYDLQEVRQAIPGAWAFAKEKTGASFGNVADFLRKKHPLLYPSLAASLIVSWPLFLGDVVKETPAGTPLGMIIVTVFASCVVVSLVALAAALFFINFAAIGELAETKFLKIPTENSSNFDDYSGAIKIFLEGVSYAAIFLIWLATLGIWKYLAIGIWKTTKTIAIFSWKLIKIIHSDKRLLCGIDGSIGGGASYWFLHTAQMSSAQGAVIILFGGLLGAALGVLNWELVSKRLLHIQTEK